MNRHLPVICALPLLLASCDKVVEALESLKPPSGSLLRVDLVKNPTIAQLGGYACFEVLKLGQLVCGTYGGLKNPPKTALLFSFDLVFDLKNPNRGVPIPLVDLLLGFTVFDGANLGSACLSFCDPDAADCVSTTDAEGACQADNAEDIDEPADIIPSVDEMFDLAESVATGDFDNSDWRVIPGGSAMEAHVQFDLDIDVMLQLADELIADAADDLIGGKKVELEIPYTAKGTMFFEAPRLGRKGVGFGPFEDLWIVK